MVTATAPNTRRRLATFFQRCFGEQQGYLAIGTRGRTTGGKETWVDRFFPYPADLGVALGHIQRYTPTHDVYYSPVIYSEPRRSTETAHTSQLVWVELDTCAPDKLRLEPSIVTETSRGTNGDEPRYHGLWCLREPMSAHQASTVSRRLTEAHLNDGADPSGWDVAQYLRVPYTTNFKYTYGDLSPEVRIVTATKVMYDLIDFDVYPAPVGESLLPAGELPPIPEGADAHDLLRKYTTTLRSTAHDLFELEPESDWSDALTQLLYQCFEAGMTAQEAFTIAEASACNKYRRDRRPKLDLWKEVLKAEQKIAPRLAIQVDLSDPPPLASHEILSSDERTLVDGDHTIVERYIDWASAQTDAAQAYHQASAFMLLSCLLSGQTRLPTSFGKFKLNLWFMILGDTTLTRKSTAMNMGSDILRDLTEDTVLATDGSIEGLMTALQARDGRPSLYYRDEVSGLLAQIRKKDYLAGMFEAMTKWYDGGFDKRKLRSETISLRNPIFCFFAGGVRERVLELLDRELIDSGFMPRWLYVLGETDLSRLQDLGPPRPEAIRERMAIQAAFQALYRRYTGTEEVDYVGVAQTQPIEYTLTLAPEVWERYNAFANLLTSDAIEAEDPTIHLPVAQRLSISTLKAAGLFACTRDHNPLPDHTVEVGMLDLLHAIAYAEHWRTSAHQVLDGAGQTRTEALLARMLRDIQRSPGVQRAELIKRHKLSALDAKQHLETLEARGLIQTSMRRGSTTIQLWPKGGRRAK